MCLCVCVCLVVLRSGSGYTVERCISLEMNRDERPRSVGGVVTGHWVEIIAIG